MIRREGTKERVRRRAEKERVQYVVRRAGAEAACDKKRRNGTEGACEKESRSIRSMRLEEKEKRSM